MVDAKKVIKKLRGSETPRKRVTLYLHKERLERFRGACSRLKLSSNKVLEELMDDFVESSKKAK